MQVWFEIMVQIKQKRGIGVDNPSPRGFSGGVSERQSYASLLYLITSRRLTLFSSEISVNLLHKERDVYVLRCQSYGYSI